MTFSERVVCASLALDSAILVFVVINLNKYPKSIQSDIVCVSNYVASAIALYDTNILKRIDSVSSRRTSSASSVPDGNPFSIPFGDSDVPLLGLRIVFNRNQPFLSQFMVEGVPGIFRTGDVTPWGICSFIFEHRVRILQADGNFIYLARNFDTPSPSVPVSSTDPLNKLHARKDNDDLE